MQVQVKCEACRGSGRVDGSGPDEYGEWDSCEECGGAGVMFVGDERDAKEAVAAHGRTVEQLGVAWDDAKQKLWKLFDGLVR